MLGFAVSLTSPSLFSTCSIRSLSNLHYPVFICRIGPGYTVEHVMCRAPTIVHSRVENYRCCLYYTKRNYRNIRVRASGRESPYDVLGVSPAATTKEIKSAYRKLALKFHPDVNKEAGAQEKFMRIKHAYNSLLNSKSRGGYSAGSKDPDFSNSTYGRYQTKNKEAEEEFYGFGDFFRDIQEEFSSWEESAATQGKPKSLWEELSEIGEEFVEFLEKELNITDQEERSSNEYGSYGTSTNVSSGKKDTNEGGSINDSIDDIEAALVQLKRELGL